MEKQAISPERWAVIDAWFDAVMAKQADYGQEIAGWIPPGFDPKGEYEGVFIDRLHHQAVYLRKDGTRRTKSVPDFTDDPFTPPEDTATLAPHALRSAVEAAVDRLRTSLAGQAGIEDVWLSPDMEGVVFDLADGTTSLLPLTDFLDLYDPIPS